MAFDAGITMLLLTLKLPDTFRHAKKYAKICYSFATFNSVLDNARDIPDCHDMLLGFKRTSSGHYARTHKQRQKPGKKPTRAETTNRKIKGS